MIPLSLNVKTSDPPPTSPQKIPPRPAPQTTNNDRFLRLRAVPPLAQYSRARTRANVRESRQHTRAKLTHTRQPCFSRVCTSFPLDYPGLRSKRFLFFLSFFFSFFFLVRCSTFRRAREQTAQHTKNVGTFVRKRLLRRLHFTQAEGKTAHSL